MCSFQIHLYGSLMGETSFSSVSLCVTPFFETTNGFLGVQRIPFTCPTHQTIFASQPVILWWVHLRSSHLLVLMYLDVKKTVREKKLLKCHDGENCTELYRTVLRLRQITLFRFASLLLVSLLHYVATDLTASNS